MNRRQTERFRRGLVKFFDEPRYQHILPFTRELFFNDLPRLFEECSSAIDPDDPETIPEIQFWGGLNK